jgi:hypothetical protein
MRRGEDTIWLTIGLGAVAIGVVGFLADSSLLFSFLILVYGAVVALVVRRNRAD